MSMGKEGRRRTGPLRVLERSEVRQRGLMKLMLWVVQAILLMTCASYWVKREFGSLQATANSVPMIQLNREEP